MRVWIFVLILLAVCKLSSAKQFFIQGDAPRNKENHPIWRLRNTSDGNAVILEPNKKLSVNFCLRRDSTVQIRDLRFSNGNRSEVVLVEMDALGIAWFRSPVDPSHDWSNFLSTGPFGQPADLHIGWHTISVRFF